MHFRYKTTSLSHSIFMHARTTPEYPEWNSHPAEMIEKLTNRVLRGLGPISSLLCPNGDLL